jgi:hypothetical protein
MLNELTALYGSRSRTYYLQACGVVGSNGQKSGRVSVSASEALLCGVELSPILHNIQYSALTRSSFDVAGEEKKVLYLACYADHGARLALIP